MRSSMLMLSAAISPVEAPLQITSMMRQAQPCILSCGLVQYERTERQLAICALKLDCWGSLTSGAAQSNQKYTQCHVCSSKYYQAHIDVHKLAAVGRGVHICFQNSIHLQQTATRRVNGLLKASANCGLIGSLCRQSSFCR